MASTGSAARPEDVHNWGRQLDEVARRIGARFARSETRARVRAYLVGLLGPVQRKNAWQVAEQIGDADPYGVQYLMGRADWDPEEVRDDLRAYVVESLGDPEAVDRAVKGAEVVIHCGAAMKGGWPEHKGGTVVGTQNVIDACKKHKVRQLVHISSMSVIDWAGSAGNGPVSEAANLEPDGAVFHPQNWNELRKLKNTLGDTMTWADDFNELPRALTTGLAAGNSDHLAHQVDAGNHLRHRVLDLDARVHLQKVERVATVVI